ncbi:hypothetical protein KM043_004551 [Ampulex compressa]|nr:hypothetical protein KM043_004551 [Ampulex compressa]
MNIFKRSATRLDPHHVDRAGKIARHRDTVFPLYAICTSPSVIPGTNMGSALLSCIRELLPDTCTLVETVSGGSRMYRFLEEVDDRCSCLHSFQDMFYISWVPCACIKGIVETDGLLPTQLNGEERRGCERDEGRLVFLFEKLFQEPVRQYRQPCFHACLDQSL